MRVFKSATKFGGISKRRFIQTKNLTNFEHTHVREEILEVDLVRNVIVIGRRRQTKQRNIAVMAMEAEKVTEESCWS